MEMASLRPACGSDFRHRAHPLADRRHIAFRRPRRRRAFGLDGRRGQVYRPGAREVPARCLGPWPARDQRQQAFAGGANAGRQRSQSLARLGRFVARPRHHRCAPLVQAANHLARQRHGRGGAGERATHLVHHAPQRRAGARAACAQGQDHASGRARRHHQGCLRASRRRQGSRRRLGVRLLRVQGLERALLA